MDNQWADSNSKCTDKYFSTEKMREEKQVVKGKTLLLILFGLIFIVGSLNGINATLFSSNNLLNAEGYLSGGVTSFEAETTDWLGQTFTTSNSFSVVNISLLIPGRSGSVGTLYISIRATNSSGEPTGSDLTTGTYNGDSISTTTNNNNWVNIPITSYSLSANTKYAIIFNVKGGSGSLNWMADTTSPTYNYGSYSASSDSGGNWTLVTGRDFLFLVQGNYSTNENLTFINNNPITRFLKVPYGTVTLINSTINITSYPNFTRLNNLISYGNFRGGFYDTTIYSNASYVLNGGSATLTNGSNYIQLDATTGTGPGTHISQINMTANGSYGIDYKTTGNISYINITLNWSIQELGVQYIKFMITNGSEVKDLGNLVPSISCGGCGQSMEKYNIFINVSNQSAILSGNFYNGGSNGNVDLSSLNKYYFMVGVYSSQTAVGSAGIVNLKIFNITSTYPYSWDPRIDLDINLWNYTKTFNNTSVKINNFGNLFSSYLSSCPNILSYCYIPLVFYSEGSGILNYFSMLFSNVGFLENSQSYNTTTYETSLETFNINLTYDNNEYTTISGTLYYDGTAYSGTRTGSNYQAIFTRSIDIPTIAQQTNKTFYWTIGLTNTSGISYYNTSFINQTIRNITLNLCGGNNNVTYINFTFKDEATDTTLNASADLATWNYYLGSGSQTKTLIFSNSSVNPNYAFCFTPAHRTMGGVLTFQYASSGYPQRQYYRSGTLTNTTTNQILYLLGTASGIYSSYQVTNTAGSPISGALITVERQFSGVWTQVSQGSTDSSGSVTFFLNYNYDHRLTVVKSGFLSNTITLRPSQSLYTIVLSSSSGNATYSLDLGGIAWRYYPGVQILQPNTVYTFGFNVTANLGNLVGCKFEILLPNSTILSTITGCSSNGGNISTTFNTLNYEKIVLKFYLNTGSGYWVVDPIEYWIDATDVSSFYTIKSFFNNLALYDDDFGETSARATFSKFVLFFFIVTILIGVLTYFTGVELSNPGMSIFIFWAIIAVASLSGWFQVEVFTAHTNSASDWFNKYYIFGLITLFMLSFYLNQWRRINS